jgi:histidine triad (HIT) family protein
VEPCIFCMIARGELPASTVYADDEFLAFDDIAPQAPVHTLVIPRRHFARMDDAVPVDVLGRLMAVVRDVAALKGVAGTGHRVIVNNGAQAGQTVGHLHVHILGGAPMGHGMVVRPEARPSTSGE